MIFRSPTAKAVLSFALAAALSACATVEGEGLADDPNFPLGYGDGCQTAIERDKSFSTKTVSDAHLFESDKAYRAGWRQGFLTCGRQDSRTPDGGRILGDENDARF